MKVAVVVPPVPSVITTSPIDSVGVASSSVMVATPVPSTMTAPMPITFDSVTANVSSVSSSASGLTATVIVLKSSPAAKLSVPLPAAKSAGLAALPSVVA